ncbi:MAG: exodeoxyribonuclease VII large subunit [Lachnospiraceae bacterium]|nr:exodeoxyribonuclease VII large subunit [Lachnospiraceae bacterium]
MFLSDYMLSRIYIKGEVSNCKYHSSGHIYFSLKDGKSHISCVMFAGNRRDGLRFKMENGQNVVVGGSINVYERDGTYQLYAADIILDGIGVLYEEFERLKIALYEEGLFDHELKKPIPKNPKKVGIVTASTGAVIRDITTIAKRRNPYVQLYLYPAKVQGDGAAISIVKGIQTLDSMDMDTIIIGRGGGSIEDLWAFNEEIVARAIFAAKTPIISGVGHGTDTSISDYVADKLAATPSEACELAIPDIRELVGQILSYEDQLNYRMDQKLRMAKYKLEQYQGRLLALSPKNQHKQQQMRLSQIQDKLFHAMHNKKTSMDHQLMMYLEKLNGLSPSAKLIGGFGYISDEGSHPVTHVAQVKEGDSICIQISDGKIHGKVTKVVEERSNTHE